LRYARSMNVITSDTIWYAILIPSMVFLCYPMPMSCEKNHILVTYNIILMILLDFLLHYGWSAGSSFHLAFSIYNHVQHARTLVSPAPQQHNRDQPPPPLSSPITFQLCQPFCQPLLTITERGRRVAARAAINCINARLGVDLPLTFGPQQKAHEIIHDMHGTTARRLGRHRCCIMERVRVA
jgi:hypothetical protein